MLWKGRLHFKQYIPSKRHRFGIKIFILCDCRTGFLLYFAIYVESGTQIQFNKKLGIPGSIVVTLMQSYLHKGHNLFVDNWFTSPALFKVLHANRTGAYGTVRKNRLGMPSFTDELEKGDSGYRHTDILLAVKWFDKRDVTMLSTIHEARTISTGKIHWKTNEQIQKPVPIIDYNKNMDSIYRSDMQISYVERVRKTVK